jgi:hypothetical protein
MGLVSVALAAFLVLWNFWLLMEWLRNPLFCGGIVWPFFVVRFGGASLIMAFALVYSYRANAIRASQLAAAAAIWGWIYY